MKQNYLFGWGASCLEPHALGCHELNQSGDIESVYKSSLVSQDVLFNFSKLEKCDQQVWSTRISVRGNAAQLFQVDNNLYQQNPSW
jgi:hypothetical protein